MAMSSEQKKLRRWFRDHGWHTSDTPTGQGFYLESPIENRAGGMHYAIDPATGEEREYSNEALLSVELDRFCVDHMTLEIRTRKHWWKKAENPLRPEENLGGGYSWEPSDDFEDWPRSAAYINIPAKDVIKMAELIKAAQADWMKGRKSKNHLNFMERISKSCLVRWIGVNASYDEIKWTYSNERLRKERGTGNREVVVSSGR